VHEIFIPSALNRGAKGVEYAGQLVILYRISHIRLACKGLMLLVVFILVTNLCRKF